MTVVERVVTAPLDMSSKWTRYICRKCPATG